MTPPAKSAKRGIAYDLADPLDFQALAPGVSWWYNWGSQPNKAVPADYVAQYGLDYYPMLWNGNYDATAVESYLQANPNIKYLLVMNEPNLTSQSNLTPTQAAAIWPGYEAISAKTGVKIGDHRRVLHLADRTHHLQMRTHRQNIGIGHGVGCR